MRRTISFSIPEDFSLEQLLAWANKFSPALILNSNSSTQNFKDKYGEFDLIAAIGSLYNLITHNDSFQQLETMLDEKDWLFGYFNYDLKNELENLESQHPDHLEFPALHFFCPQYVLQFEGTKLHVLFHPEKNSEENIFPLIDELFHQPVSTKPKVAPKIKERVSKPEYISNVLKIREHIQRGDIYEMNYCVEFFAENVDLDPVQSYSRLNAISPMPFSCFLKTHNQYLMCASPERFLAKRGSKLISQPIKGTARRGKNEAEDLHLREQLSKNPKEQSENVMIVDLVRNDLSRTAAKGSVKVEELFGIYTFQQLHQMISTVVSELKSGHSGLEAIQNSFPMGSMTGAPKVRAMQLIEEFETTKRGLYSGAVGYFDPIGDFDFNVVIRSIQYNAGNKYLNFMVGSAITIGSDAENEYKECLLKADGMIRALNS